MFFLFLKHVHIPAYLQYEWLKIFKQYNIKTVIDVGANRGYVSKALHYLLPNAIIYAFEPIIEELEYAKENIRSEKLVPVNMALSNKKGDSTFYINDYSPASSFMPLSSSYKKEAKHLGKTKKINVLTTTLDDFFKNKLLEKNIFLKIDTQGSEKLILTGGKKTLKKILIIEVETSFREQYKNQCYFEDIYAFLILMNYVYIGNISLSQFYPLFNLPYSENSVFVNKNLLSAKTF